MQISDLYMPKSRTQFGETQRQGVIFKTLQLYETLKQN